MKFFAKLIMRKLARPFGGPENVPENSENSSEKPDDLENVLDIREIFPKIMKDIMV